MREDLTMQAFLKTIFTSRFKVISATSLLLFLMTLLGLIVVESPVAYANSESNLLTIYHVYLDDDYIGSVDDQAIIEQHISTKIKTMNDSDRDYTYGYEQEIAFIPERVFSTNLNIDQVLATLDQELVIDIQATTLQLGDKVLGHFASIEDADQAIFNYKKLYVDEEVLNQLADEEAEKQIELEIGESIITDVTLSEEVTLFESIVSETDLITVKEAVRLLDKGTLEDMIHNVSTGDTLYSIGERYNLSEQQLLELNDKDRKSVV